MTTKFLRKPKSFVLRPGRTTRAQQNAINKYLPVYGINYKNHGLVYESFFSNKAPVILEIGFGSGDATIIIAKNNPNINYIAVEVYPSGVGTILQKIRNYEIKNLRIIQHDATEVIKKMITNQSLSGIHIFFPDPWPKKKHHKRRLISSSFLVDLEKKLVKDCYLHLVTDCQNYKEQITEEIDKNKNLVIQNDAELQIIKNRPKTKFEKRAITRGNDIFDIVAFKKKWKC